MSTSETTKPTVQQDKLFAATYEDVIRRTALRKCGDRRDVHHCFSFEARPRNSIICEVQDLSIVAANLGNRVVASEEVKNEILKIGINECARESGFDRKNFIRKLVRNLPVKRNSYMEFERWLRGYKSQDQ